jgi:hypothetical protein
MPVAETQQEGPAALTAAEGPVVNAAGRSPGPGGVVSNGPPAAPQAAGTSSAGQPSKQPQAQQHAGQPSRQPQAEQYAGQPSKQPHSEQHAGQPSKKPRAQQHPVCDPVASQKFVEEVASRVEQLGLWLRYGSGFVKVGAAAVVDVMRVQGRGRVYRHRSAPVLLMCSDAQTSAQLAASLQFACLEQEGSFLLLQSTDTAHSRDEGQHEQHLQGNVQHIVPVIMMQACEPGIPNRRDWLLEDVDEKIQHGGVHARDNFARIRWLDSKDIDEIVLLRRREDLQIGFDPAGPAITRGGTQDSRAPRLGWIKGSAQRTGARNTDTPDRENVHKCALFVVHL